MTFTCPACRNAPPRGQWPRSWRWKTERGFKNHKCYADEEQLPPSVRYHSERDNRKAPDWLKSGDTLLCPHCGELFRYGGPQNSLLHFACPLCKREVQFICIGDWETETVERICSICGAPMVERTGKYGAFWGCSAWSRATPCKGKPVMKKAVIFEDVLTVEIFQGKIVTAQTKRLTRGA